MIRIVVASQPALASEIASFLSKEEGVQVAAAVGSAAEAAASARSSDARVLFLDLDLPDIEQLRASAINGLAPPPAIVLLTAADPRRLRILERRGAAYLVKPLSRDKVGSAVRKARARLERGEAAGATLELPALLEDLRRVPEYPETIRARAGGGETLLRAEEIDWIEAAANYVHIHARGQKHVSRCTMTVIEGQLDPARFARIHRCLIVNLERIQSFEKAMNGRRVVILKDGTRLQLSRGRRRRLPTILSIAV